ncbi:AMP-binding protein [Tabrizicola sp.]|uniref:AMP-binding protein n=1 Tax=Tabrizicola sp. TaxID=2005166 RepID=UPI00286CC7B3|nr:AMP-binding protein [Tabrizicola sp.]
MQNSVEDSVAARFEEIATTYPDHPAIILQDTEYSFSKLLALAISFTVKYTQSGIDANSTIQTESSDLPIVLASLLAASSLGARFAEGAINIELAGLYPITHRIAVELPLNPIAGEQSLLIDSTWSPAEVLRGNPEPHLRSQQVDIDAPWLLLATSGTTGIPKVVGLSQRIVLRRSLAVKDEFRSGETRFSSLFPYDCRPFFARAMGALLNGAAIVDRGGWDFWVQNGVNRVAGSLKQVKALGLRGKSASKIAVVEVSGAKIADHDALDLLQHFDLVDDTYGATETSKSFSNFLTLSPNNELRKQGFPRDSLVDIVDQDGNVLGSTQTGEVRVRNSYCAEIYIFNATSRMEILTGDYFYPGDIAHFTKDGVLEILGRKDKSLLNFDGVKMNAGIIDALLTSVEGILGAAAFQSPKAGKNEVIAFAEIAAGTNRLQVLELARKACTDALGAKLAPMRIWPIDTIPRRRDGSPDREKCADLIVEALEKMNRTDD